MLRRPLIFLLALLLGLSSAQQSDVTRALERQIQEYEQLLEARRQEQLRIERELGELRNRLEATIRERDQVSEELARLRQERSTLLDEIAALEADLAQTEAEIVALQARLEELKGRIATLLVSLYRQSAGRYARVLAHSESLYELRVKNYYLSILTNQDVELLNELDRTVLALEEKQLQLTAQVNERNAKAEALAANAQQLETAQANLNRLIGELEATREGQLAQRSATLQEQARLEQTIAGAMRALEQERVRIQRELEEARRRAEQAVSARERQAAEQDIARASRDLAAITAPTRQVETDWALPFPNARLVSRYREEGTWIVLRAEQEGAAVRSALSGTVTMVQRVQANSGFLVVVAHSPELSTAYQGLQPPEVNVGDRVNQGDILGYLGGGVLIPPDTLRFMVNVTRDGRPAWVDPAPYLGFR
jgi:murein DD-endopeptidase MepM/ murein hydrolase activator NlpD